MSPVWKRISANPALLGFLGGLATVLAFPPIRLTSFVLLCPVFLILAVQRARSTREAFLAGFLATLAIMLGAFYWVVYVLHIFGHLPWIVAALLYLLFSGLGGLGFPLFTVLYYRARRRFPALDQNPAWYVLGIPALFVLTEWGIPKLFPWYVGHALYQQLWLIQIIEYTGALFLTFGIFSWGGLLAAMHLKAAPLRQLQWALAVPASLTMTAIGVSLNRLAQHTPPAQVKNIALIQANIGSLEKVEARAGIHSKVRYTLEKYMDLTERQMQKEPKPDLILWPETAMPFSLVNEIGYAQIVRDAVGKWNRPLITGGYAPASRQPFLDYNAAFLLEPGRIAGIYNKNILLAFGEYFPGGEWYPAFYHWFPQVSRFQRGEDQPIFTLSDGTRLGVTICYEAIVPSFYSKVASQGVLAVVNLTNDSWFGPTSEPYQHAALSIFRAIETRTPLVRVTNTGISFAVDALGHLSERTPVYEEGAITVPVALAAEPAFTVYLRWGDWWVGLCLVMVLFFLGRAYVPVRI